ncbi:hypothetical protein I6E29_08705 [Arcanobacterium haemolyticum]|nr:hypothetical protein [Arcanobacterium haemolyticum]
MRRQRSFLGILVTAALAVGALVGPASGADQDPAPAPDSSSQTTNDEATGSSEPENSGEEVPVLEQDADQQLADTEAQMPASMAQDRSADDDYKFEVAWSNPVNASTKGYSYEDEAHTILSFDKMFNKLHTATVDVAFNLTDTGNIKSLPVGAVKVTLPSALFKTWAGDASTHWAGPDTDFHEENQMTTQVPQAPATADSTSFNWSGDPKDVNDVVTVTNAKPINGSKSNSMSFNYNFIPTLLGVDGQGNYAKTFDISMEVDSNGDGAADFSKKQSLTVKAHTTTKVSKVVMNKLGGEKKPEEGLYFK